MGNKGCTQTQVDDSITLADLQAVKETSHRKRSRRPPRTPDGSDNEDGFDPQGGPAKRTLFKRVWRAWRRAWHCVLYKWMQPLQRRDMRPWRRRVLAFVHKRPPRQTPFGHFMTLCIVVNTVALAMVYAGMQPAYADALDIINQGRGM